MRKRLGAMAKRVKEIEQAGGLDEDAMFAALAEMAGYLAELAKVHKGSRRDRPIR